MPAYKARYRQIYQRLVDQVLLPDLLTARMNALRDMIRPWVGMDTQKLVTMDQFEQAMTADSSAGTPAGPGGPGGLGGGGMGSAPGLQPFLAARSKSVKAQLAAQ